MHKYCSFGIYIFKRLRELTPICTFNHQIKSKKKGDFLVEIFVIFYIYNMKIIHMDFIYVFNLHINIFPGSHMNIYDKILHP